VKSRFGALFAVTLVAASCGSASVSGTGGHGGGTGAAGAGGSGKAGSGGAASGGSGGGGGLASMGIVLHGQIETGGPSVTPDGGTANSTVILSRGTLMLPGSTTACTDGGICLTGRLSP
jgi:hypothetical protein